MALNSRHMLALSQILFGLSILVCILLIPHYFLDFDQGGISNYGTEITTKPFFTIGFLAASVGAAYTAATFKIDGAQKTGLIILAVMYTLVMLSTYTYKNSGTVEDWHHLTALLLLITMLAILILFFKKIVNSINLSLVLVVFVIGLILGLLTSVGVVTQLLTSQLLTGLSFGYIISKTTKQNTNNI